jgi:hypothetical protein
MSSDASSTSLFITIKKKKREITWQNTLKQTSVTISSTTWALSCKISINNNYSSQKKVFFTGI